MGSLQTVILEAASAKFTSHPTAVDNEGIGRSEDVRLPKICIKGNFEGECEITCFFGVERGSATGAHDR